MRIIRLKAPGETARFELHDVPAPEPGPGELLVRIRACSLNFHDQMVRRGLIPVPDGRVPLSDAAGDVVAIGAGVEGHAIGDCVVSTFWPYWFGGAMTATTRRDIPGETIDGYAADVVCRPAHAFTRAPKGCTPLEAATLPCAAVTAWRGLVVCGGVKPGDTVLVQGTGGVSLFALQFARAAGARVIATSSSDEKLERLTQLGADEVINYRAVPDWSVAVRRLTDGRGVDHVVEVGGSATLMQSIAACRLGGHIALIGLLTGFSGEVAIPAVFANQIRISGVSIGSRADQEDMIRAIEVNRIEPVTDRSFPLHEIDAAFSHYEARRHIGKVGVVV